MPIKFVEGLMFFYSIDAKVYVLNTEQIGKLRPYVAKREFLPQNYDEIHLEVAEHLEKCQFPETKDVTSTILGPVRILSDQIKIDQFLNNFINGEQNLNNFEERTYLYAKSFMFPRRDGLSFPILQKEFGIRPSLPFAHIWSSGNDYHFQSNTGIGSQISENLPYVAPHFLLRSDFKSHFLSGSFEGNIAGISTGSYPDTFSFVEPSSNQITLEYKSFSIESVNYLAIMGGNFGPYSVGFGSYFPIHKVIFDQFNTRGILAHYQSNESLMTFN